VFFGVSNCQTLKKNFNNCHTLYKVSIVSQWHRRMVRTFLFSYFFVPNLMKPSYRWLSLWLHHKIEGQIWGGKEGGNDTQFEMDLANSTLNLYKCTKSILELMACKLDVHKCWESQK
jgi:hypothetical protein